MLMAGPLAAEPPQGRIARIGVLNATTPEQDGCIAPLRHGLAALGYSEGLTHELELRYAAGDMEQLPGLAADLLRRKVDLIVVTSGTAVEIAAKAAPSLPIVMASSFYPVETGI